MKFNTENWPNKGCDPEVAWDIIRIGKDISIFFARNQKVAEPRESAREKLDALVKDTASKVSPEKTPKAKSKAKTGPEL